MNDLPAFDEAVVRLGEVKARLSASGEVKHIVDAQSEVLSRFQPIFSKDHLPILTKEEFQSFLLFEHNHHWNGLHRQYPKVCKDMARLREVLAHLLYDVEPIEERFDNAVGAIPGMGKAIMTAILLIAFPKEYGVWNNTSEGGLKSLGLWPDFKRGDSKGTKYAAINKILVKLASELGTDLWTLDALWWAVKLQDDARTDTESAIVNPLSPEALYPSFGFDMERHLQDFIADNWEKISLNEEWEIYSEDGDDDSGIEYPCDGVGFIDILARQKNGKDWLVIELKRGQTNDDTVGQILRYMGWVKARMAAEQGGEIHGVIIARQSNEKLLYALNATPNVTLQLYKVEFKLQNAPKLEE